MPSKPSKGAVGSTPAPEGAAGVAGVPAVPKPVLKAQKIAAKLRKDQAAAGFSPNTMRKAQVLGMGANASLSMVEDAVRAVEGGVLSDLSADAKLRNRVTKVEKRLEDLGLRLRDLRGCLTAPDLASKVTQAEIRHSTLTAKAAVILTDVEKEQLVTNLEEAQKIVASLDGVGSKRNHILLHCLNGLANAKVATASTGEERKEVLSQLFHLLFEDQNLEVPHNNSQVRLNHCLKICERIIARAVDLDEVVALEAAVAKLERTSASGADGEASSGAGAGNTQVPPPIEGGEDES